MRMLPHGAIRSKGLCEQTAGERSAESDFQISGAGCEQLSATQNTNKEGIRVVGQHAGLGLYFRVIWMFGRMFT